MLLVSNSGKKEISKYFITDEHTERILLYKKLSVIERDGDDKTNIIETANLGNSGNLTSA